MDDLLKMLTEKIEALKTEKEQNEGKVREIRKLNDIIEAIQENPFSLCTLDEGTVMYLSNALSLDDSYLQTLARNKVIYDGYLQFGEEAVPQISLVEEFVEDTKKALVSKKCDLTDEVAEYQESILLHQGFTQLLEELANPDSYVSSIDLLITLLDDSSFEEKDKNDIKLAIISRNHRIYQTESTKFDTSQIRKEEITNDGEIQKIEDELQERFGPETLQSLKTVSNLLSSCKTKEEIDMVMQEWKYVFPAQDLTEVIDGLISLKNIEILLLTDIVGSDLESCEEDMKEINLQLDLLNEYKESVLTLEKQEIEAIPIETDISLSKSKLQQALDEYNEDPLATPNCVLFLNDSIERDIKAIDDKETLEDVFLLIEQLKNNNFSYQSTPLETTGRDLSQLRPSSSGRQARVVYTRLSGNIYGIIQVFGRKSSNPKSTNVTLKNRIKNCNLGQLKREIEDPDVLNDYVERTKTISHKLKEDVSTGCKGRTEKGNEGVKLG